MERLAVPVLGVHELDECVDDVVDRNDIGAPGVRQQDRGQRRQHRQLGQHAEEVVRPVDLVHLTGARIAHHHRRAVDAVAQPRRASAPATRLRTWSGGKGSELLADVEVVLGVLAGEVARHRDRRHVVQRGVQPPRQLDDRAGALDVGGSLLGLAGGDVVDRRAMHDMIDMIPQLGDGLVAQRELGQVCRPAVLPAHPTAPRGVRSGPATGGGPAPTPAHRAGCPADATRHGAR